MNILFFDTETTGLPSSSYPHGHEMQPHITQLGFILEKSGVDVMAVDALIKPDNWRIHPCSGTGISAKSSVLTGITMEMCEAGGIPIADAVELFIIAAENADMIVCHNTSFDTKIIAHEYARLQPDANPRGVLCGKPYFCTMKTATPICKIPKKDGKRSSVSFKWPKLEEAMLFFFDEKLEGAHSAIVDIMATRRVFHKLVEVGAFDDQFNASIDAGHLPEDFFEQIGAA